MERLKFRKALPRDGEGILKIYHYSILHDDATYITACPTWDEWDREHDTEQRIVALIDEKVVGFVALQNGGQAGVVSVYVDKEHRRQGIGSRLLKCLVTYNVYQNQAWKKQYFLLHSKIFTNNTASIQLHEKAGFRRVGYYKNNLMKNGKWRDVYVYERRIRIVS